MLCGMLPALGLASNMEMDMTANIINNTCQITIPENGKVSLPIVGKSWFYSSDGSARLKPADPAGERALQYRSLIVTVMTPAPDRRCTLPLNHRQPNQMVSQNRYSITIRPSLPAALKTWVLLFFQNPIIKMYSIAMVSLMWQLKSLHHQISKAI
jgi:hypothetical protein